MKPETDKYHGHLTTGDVIAVLKDAKPATCIITHMGLKMMKAGPSKEAEKIEKESGVKVLAAKDGLRFKV
jgi:phosphoribosyl 1,2-cyclic phosphodiesterase